MHVYANVGAPLAERGHHVDGVEAIAGDRNSAAINIPHRRRRSGYLRRRNHRQLQRILGAAQGLVADAQGADAGRQRRHAALHDGIRGPRAVRRRRLGRLAEQQPTLCVSVGGGTVLNKSLRRTARRV